jgi:outer membrane biosynthesis protein TonB
MAALALHLALFLAVTFLHRPNFAPAGSAVPITIVSSGPTTDSRQAEQAPQTQTAQTETPVPEAKPPQPAPAPQPAPPAPQPPVKAEKPTPKPQPAPTKTAPKPLPKTAPSKDNFNLDALAADVRSARSAQTRPANAARGPARAETAPEQRVDAGQGVSQSDIAGLSQLLERLWNPNCEVAGANSVVVPVRFTVGFDGRVSGQIKETLGAAGANPVVATAARRAIDAIHQAEPYPDTFRGATFTVNFDAKKACAGH